MPTTFDHAIRQALGPGPDTPATVTQNGNGALPSCFGVGDLVASSVQAAALELADHVGARAVTLNRRLAALWFDRTLHPEGWDLPSVWDAVAGAYRTSDGWIRLHTNAPHHRDAALRVLDCLADKTVVATATSGWEKTDLERAIVAEGGAAAAMHSLSDWAAHPQGQAVAGEPLIAWDNRAMQAAPVRLHDLRVLDLTRVLAGPVATRFLAGFGARVLRIDPPWWDEPAAETEVTLGKKRAGLTLTHPEDRQVFERLLAQADVLVHGYRPGALQNLGYGPERLRSLAPQMIDVSLCAYGWTGPWATRRGFDSLVQMSCGIAAEGMRRKGVDHPVPLPVQALDHATGYLMAAAVLRALRVRNRTGDVLSARFSLARTAALLVSEGPRDFRGVDIQASAQDLSPTPEQTDWGPARRVRFPLHLDTAEPVWRYPAGRLRTSAPAW